MIKFQSWRFDLEKLWRNFTENKMNGNQVFNGTYRNTNNMPIEQLVAQAYEKVADSATQDLRGAVDRIEANNQQKQQLRKMQQKLEYVRKLVAKGDYTNAKKQMTELQGMAKKAGYDTKSDFYKTLGTPSKDDKNTWETGLKSMETSIDAEAQSYSDVGQKLQFELTQANNIYHRTTKAQSDIAAKNNRTLDAITGNIKG